jgi:hypothetical protein
MSWDSVAPWLSGPELAYGSLDLATISVPSQSFRASEGGGAETWVPPRLLALAVGVALIAP